MCSLGKPWVFREWAPHAPHFFQLCGIPSLNLIFQNWTSNMQKSDSLQNYKGTNCKQWKSRSSYLWVYPHIYVNRGLVYWKMSNLWFCQNEFECQLVWPYVQTSQWTLNISVCKQVLYMLILLSTNCLNCMWMVMWLLSVQENFDG